MTCNAPPDLPVLIGSAEACRALGIDRSTLTRWVKAGKVQAAAQIGRHGAYVFTAEAINAAAAERASLVVASLALRSVSARGGSLS